MFHMWEIWLSESIKIYFEPLTVYNAAFFNVHSSISFKNWPRQTWSNFYCRWYYHFSAGLRDAKTNIQWHYHTQTTPHPKKPILNGQFTISATCKIYKTSCISIRLWSKLSTVFQANVTQLNNIEVHCSSHLIGMPRE